jgi:multidrug efflux system membrane fusion protein
VTTGFANLSEGAKVTVSSNYQAPTPDLAPRRPNGGAKGRGASQGGQAGGGAKAPR